MKMTLNQALAIADAYAAQSKGKIAKPGSLDKLHDSTTAGFAALSKRHEAMLASVAEINRQLEKLETDVAFLEAGNCHQALLPTLPHPLQKLRMLLPTRRLQ